MERAATAVSVMLTGPQPKHVHKMFTKMAHLRSPPEAVVQRPWTRVKPSAVGREAWQE